MAKRYIILKPVQGAEGSGVATISDTTVTVSLTGTYDEYALYFASKQNPGDRIDAGTICGGETKSYEMSKSDAEKIDTVILTRDAKTVISGSLASAVPAPDKEAEKTQEKTSPLLRDDGFAWVKIEDGRFAENVPIIRHIFENINVIARISKHRHYYYGTNGALSAVAVPSEKNEPNPFMHLADCARYINGYWVVCANKAEKYFYSID